MDKEKKYSSSEYPSAIEEKARKLAWYYVNATCGNKSRAYYLYRLEQDPDYIYDINVIRTTAYNAFHRVEVQRWVDYYTEESRKEYKNQKDKNIAHLNEILDDASSTKKERIDAIKELNVMFGYNNKNVNVNGKVSEEITVEIV